VIVGGLTFGTVLTLFVVPTAYTLLAGGRHAETEERMAALQAQPGHAD
jgi:multidrug efflux pump